jgi:hypothetical protein
MFADEGEEDASKFAHIARRHEGARVYVVEEAVESVMAFLELLLPPFEQEEAEHVADDLQVHEIVALFVLGRDRGVGDVAHFGRHQQLLLLLVELVEFLIVICHVPLFDDGFLLFGIFYGNDGLVN